MVADQLVSTVTGMLTGLTEAGAPLGSDTLGSAALPDAINAFATELENMDNSALVDIIETIDINALFDADGGFNTDALVTVFSSLDPTITQDLQVKIKTEK